MLHRDSNPLKVALHPLERIVVTVKRVILERTQAPKEPLKLFFGKEPDEAVDISGGQFAA